MRAGALGLAAGFACTAPVLGWAGGVIAPDENEL